MGMIMIYSGIAVLAAAVILTIVFKVRKPVYQPHQNTNHTNSVMHTGSPELSAESIETTLMSEKTTVMNRD